MHFIVLPAHAADLDALTELENKVFVTSDGKLNKRAFRYHLQSKNLLMVAKPQRDTPVIAGYILVLLYRHSARIYSLAVDPEFQRQGVAKLLLTSTLDQIVSRGIGKVVLELRQENMQAFSLYQGLGFKLGSHLNDYYGPGENGIAMEWRPVALSAARSNTSELKKTPLRP